MKQHLCLWLASSADCTLTPSLSFMAHITLHHSNCLLATTRLFTLYGTAMFTSHGNIKQGVAKWAHTGEINKYLSAVRMEKSPAMMDVLGCWSIPVLLPPCLTWQRLWLSRALLRQISPCHISCRSRFFLGILNFACRLVLWSGA